MSSDATRDSGAQRFRETYGRLSKAPLAIEREVFGANVGANGYTTIAQADDLANRLGLRSGMRLLDVGAGRGWPGLHLAKKSGCEVVASDVPSAAVRGAVALARRRRVLRRCCFVLADGARLPFRPRTFDAVVHTDVL